MLVKCMIMDSKYSTVINSIKGLKKEDFTLRHLRYCMSTIEVHLPKRDVKIVKERQEHIIHIVFHDEPKCIT